MYQPLFLPGIFGKFRESLFENSCYLSYQKFLQYILEVPLEFCENFLQCLSSISKLKNRRLFFADSKYLLAM